MARPVGVRPLDGHSHRQRIDGVPQPATDSDDGPLSPPYLVSSLFLETGLHNVGASTAEQASAF